MMHKFTCTMHTHFTESQFTHSLVGIDNDKQPDLLPDTDTDTGWRLAAAA